MKGEIGAAGPERTRGWMRWIVGGRRRPQGTAATVGRPAADAGPAAHAWARLCSLPERLQGCRLPNGVVELVVDDGDAPLRKLLDIHDSRVTAIDPGSAVPWASISGSSAAWVAALGPLGELDGLRLTGDKPLALRLLSAACPG